MDMKYVLANWKMYPTPQEAVELFDAVQAGLEERFAGRPAGVEVIVCPPSVSLARLHALRQSRLVALGAQNCHWESEGPYTGEISPAMLSGLVSYVLLGHSERRAAGETDEEIARKVAAVAREGLTPILFVGEDEPTDSALEQTERRLTRGLSGVDLGEHRVLVVYEPTWAIGGEQAAGAEHVRRVVEQLKARLEDLGASESRVIYGGTVNGDNVEQFAALEVLDGVGATRAGLDADELLGIVDRVLSPDPQRTDAG